MDVAFRAERQFGAATEQRLERYAARHDVVEIRNALACVFVSSDMHVRDLQRHVPGPWVVGFRADQLTIGQDEVIYISTYRHDVALSQGRILGQIQHIAVPDHA